MSTDGICQIPGDPDIAGVGVRASVYIQACLAGFNLVYMVHTRLFNQINRQDLDNLQLEYSDDNATDVASTTALDAPATALVDIEQASQHTRQSSPSPRDIPSDELDRRDAEEYQAFVRSNREYLDMTKVLERGLFMVGFAVIVSAILEAKATGLTAYHAVIILNISQINNWSGFVLLLMRGGFRPSERGGWSRHFLVTRDSLTSSIPCTVHAVMMSGLGLYFWSDLKPFLEYAAEANDCQPLTYLWLFGSIDISSNALRIASLVFYAVSAIPIIGLYFLGAILVFALLGFLLVSTLLIGALSIAAMISILLYGVFIYPIVTFILRPLLQTPFIQSIVTSVGRPIAHILHSAYLSVLSYTTSLLVGPSYSQLVTFPIGVFFCAPLICTIVSTELTIRINRPNVEPETEDRWTYGQTLALFAALVSLALYLHELSKLIRKWRRKVMKKAHGTESQTSELESIPLRPLFVERNTQTEDEL